MTDDGPGIPAEFQSTLFERFTRADSSRARTTGSTGLGLAIVQAVVDAHGGEVGVASVPGETTFTVSLPLDHTLTPLADVEVEADEVEADEVTAEDDAAPEPAAPAPASPPLH